MIAELFFISDRSDHSDHGDRYHKNAAHAECHCPGDIAVRMRELLSGHVLVYVLLLSLSFP